MLVMYGVGAYLVEGHKAVALAVGAGLAVILHLKPQLHAIAARIGDKDFKSIMQFVVVALVILPVLPNAFYGPYQVLNPFRIWLMVVLIVAISLAGYLFYKFFGPKVGALAGGVLGGLVSSTATTVSYARISRAAGSLTGVAALVILIASAIVFLRVLILIGAAAPGFLTVAGWPIGTVFGGLVAVSLAAWWSGRRLEANVLELENPTQLRFALMFAALYGAVLLAVAAASAWLGDAGLYAVAILSGLTDMDAITLSVSQLVGSGQVPGQTGWRLILVAAMSNLVFKGGLVLALGNRPLFGRIAAFFAGALALGLAVLFLWPE
jgi:uncharacterized membrane protein (DUF4010 family)